MADLTSRGRQAGGDAARVLRPVATSAAAAATAPPPPPNTFFVPLQLIKSRLRIMVRLTAPGVRPYCQKDSDYKLHHFVQDLMVVQGTRRT